MPLCDFYEIVIKNILFAFVALLISSPSFAEEISKEMWLAQMKIALPRHFCSSEQYFRQCFHVQEQECRAVASESTNACLKQLENLIPLRLKQPADGTSWGWQVGACAGNAYEVALKKQKLNTAKCNNSNHWR